MISSPIVDCGQAMVVLEGDRRLRWRRVAAAQWIPTGCWPDQDDLAGLADRIDRREPVLVLLSQQAARVEVLAEEFRQAPESVRSLALDPDDDVVTLEVPLLDWLPDTLRQRGLRFARAVADQLAGTPKAFRAPIVLEPVDGQAPWIRFGALSAVLRAVDLPHLVRTAFCPGRHAVDHDMPEHDALLWRAHAC